MEGEESRLKEMGKKLMVVVRVKVRLTSVAKNVNVFVVK